MIEEKNLKHIQSLLKKLPESPGVYKMKNSDGEVIYVGKAKNLKNRVKSYFQKSAGHGVKTQKMLEYIEDIEWVEVGSETEALILETNYIKELRPKYNILMKDDKNFVYVRIPLKDDFPRVEIVRQLKKDGAKYFGPKTSKGKLEMSIDFLRKMFPLHTCKLEMIETSQGVICKGSEKYPCLEYQMKRCAAPCIGKIAKLKYHAYIDKVLKFFEGKYDEVLEEVKKQMIEAAGNKNFEKAAKLRDTMLSIEDLSAKQVVSGVNLLESQDIIGVFHDLGKTFVTLFQVRAGKMIHNENFILQNEGEYEEMIRAFLTGFYEQAGDMPKEILLPQELEEKYLLEGWFEQELQTKVKILFPQKGKKHELIDLAMQNAKSFAESQRARWEADKIKKEQAEKDIINLITNYELPITNEKENLRQAQADTENKAVLDTRVVFPKRMECFDISHFSGEATVASMVVFIDGLPKNSEYRHYKLKTLEKGEIDDFKSLGEVLDRRLNEVENALLFQSQQKLDERYAFRKLKKKELQELKAESLDLSTQKQGKTKKEKGARKEESKKEKLNNFYALFQEDKILYWAEIKKYSAKLSLIIEMQGKEKHKKDFFFQLFQKLQGTDLWMFSDLLEENEEIGFKKLKTLEKDWKLSPGLVPQELLEDIHKESGYALKIRILKQSKNTNFFPNFMLIDGGKGQLSSVVGVFKKHGWTYENNAFHKDGKNIVLCSLAKKEEEVFFPYESAPRLLKNTSEGSYLLQRLRDEAHRFAITFNRNTRIKTSLSSELDTIEGLGKAASKKLLKTFGSVEGVRNASKENLELCVGKKLAQNICVYFQKGHNLS